MTARTPVEFTKDDGLGGVQRCGNEVTITAIPASVRSWWALLAIAADVAAPASNTAAVVTYAASAAKKHYLHAIRWSYDGAPTGGNLKVADVAGNNVLNLDITAAGPGELLFHAPIVSAAVNTAMIVTLAAGGAGISGKLSCQHEAL